MKGPPRKRKAVAPPAPVADESASQPKTRTGTVVLWGEAIEENDSAVKMAIKNHGDAIDLGISGTIWITKRQMYGGKVYRAEGYDFVRVNYVYASMLAQSCQQCE